MPNFNHIRKIALAVGVIFFTVLFQFPHFAFNTANAAGLSAGPMEFGFDYNAYQNKSALKQAVYLAKLKQKAKARAIESEQVKKLEEQRKLARLNAPYTRYNPRDNSFEDAENNLQTGSFTAYNSLPGQCDGNPNITADGTRTHWGVVAAPRNIPFGTKMRIEGFGDKIFVVHDRGGAIHGNRFDVWFASYSDAIAFGRRTLKYEIVE